MDTIEIDELSSVENPLIIPTHPKLLSANHHHACVKLLISPRSKKLKNNPKQITNENRITYFVVSCIVAIFINFICGGAAIIASIKSHKELSRQDSEGFKRARLFGYIAFILNVMGILTTMIPLCFIYFYIGNKH